MAIQTTVEQRRKFYQRHQAGESYQDIAGPLGLSKECVRYWCRRQRDGGTCQTQYQRSKAGLLSQFDSKVRYAVLRLKLEHPRWGPRSIRHRLTKRPSLTGLRLPKEAQIGRYLHQWSCFQRPVAGPGLAGERPNQPTAVHQRWQLDFKMGIALANGQQVNLHTVRDPVGEACLGAVIYPAGLVGQASAKVTAAQARITLRRCFARWQTLPAEVQTDGETTLSSHRHNDFPTDFTLWLQGLAIEHRVIRPAQPTDNAEVERCHRTINDYAIVGNEGQACELLQAVLDEAVEELAFELPSRAEGCAGRPPIEAHPELNQPPRPFRPELELAHFDLSRVDAYLAGFVWSRHTSKNAQVSLGGQRYFVSRAYAHRQISIRFDPADRHLVFYDPQQPDHEICRRPALGLQVENLTGLACWPAELGPQQLPLPLFTAEGVNF
jgi:transposase InsO family protein